MIFKPSDIFTIALISWIAFHSIFCINIYIDRYKIVQPHAGIKKCVFSKSWKRDAVAISISKKTEECRHWSNASSTNHSSEDGYAEKLNTVLAFQPKYFVEERRLVFVSAIPGSLNIWTKLDIFVSSQEPTPLDHQFVLYMSEEPLKIFETITFFLDKNNAVFTTIFMSENTFCGISNHSVEASGAHSKSLLTDLQYAKISITLEKQLVMILVDDKEQCRYNLKDFATNIGSFHYLYVQQNFGGDRFLHKIQLDRNLK